jgi:threonine dehydrogenase-like Zn-dependent dehydrogenase
MTWRTAVGDPGPDQVVVALEACVVDGTFSGVGRVDRAGENAGHLTGARVVVGPFSPCGECDVCGAGDTVLCPTAVATLPGSMLVAAARWVCPLTGDLALPSPAAALLGADAGLAYTMLCRLGIGAGQQMAVVGDGPVAAFARQLAAARGARVVEPAAAGQRQSLLCVLETSGTAAGRARAVQLITPGARLAFAGRAEPGEVMPVGELLEHGAMIAAVPGVHPDLLPELAALAVKGELDLAAVAALEPAGTLAPEPRDLESGPRRRVLVF